MGPSPDPKRTSLSNLPQPVRAGWQEQTTCVCGHMPTNHVRRADGSERCVNCQSSYGGCKGYMSAKDRQEELRRKYPPCVCGHEFHKAHCRDLRCQCSTYTVPASIPLLVQAAALKGAGVKVVTVVVPMARLAETDEVSVAMQIERDLLSGSDVVYIQRENGLYLVLKNQDDPDEVGGGVLTDQEQFERLLALRERLAANLPHH